MQGQGPYVPACMPIKTPNRNNLTVGTRYAGVYSNRMHNTLTFNRL